MKKIICLCLTLALALSLCACGVPEGFSKNTYKATKDAVKVLTAFVEDGKDALEVVVELDALARAVEEELPSLTDATEKATATEIAMTLRSVIYTINRSGGNVSDLEKNSIRITRDILDRKIGG